MVKALWHVIYGNDAPPWMVAAARGTIISGLLAASSVIAAWQAGASGEVMAAAGLNVLIGGILLRVFGEGAVDQYKERNK